MADILNPAATNPDAREGVDPNLDPNQVVSGGNPAPAAAPAKDPAIEAAAKAKADADAAAAAEAAKKAEDAAKADPNAVDDTPLDVTKWGTTNTEEGDAVLTLLQNSGVSQEDAKALLFDAIQAGDLSKLDKAALEAKVGKVKATLILSGAETFLTKRRDAANATVASLHEEVGGKENWKKVAEWANKSVDADELAEYRDMINAGGRQAKLAAGALKSAYEAADGNSSLGVTVVLPGSRQEAPKVEPLTKAGYVDALEKLHAAHNGRPPAHLRQALLTARENGRKLGK